MKLDIVKNAKRNLIWGALSRLYQILVPMFIRRLFIYRLGIEYAGLGGLFISVLNILNLAETGIESAVLFFMYKPIQVGDTETVRRLLGLIREYYKYIGLLVLAVGLVITPFTPRLIAGEIPPDINVYIIFLMNLASTVLSYWLYAYKETLLSVHMRSDLVSRTRLGALTIKYIGQLLVLLCFANYYLYLSIDVVSKIVERLLSLITANKKYPLYKATLRPTAAMKVALREKTNALIFHKIGGVIVNSADPIVISAFLGLAVLGKYENYKVIMSAVLGFVMLVSVSVQAGIGHLVAGNKPAENSKLFERYMFLVYVLSTVCCCCFLNLYQPVITLWLNSSMLLDENIVVLLCMYFYVLLLMIPGNVFENASGLWTYDRYRPLLEGALNLGLNLTLIRLIGLEGVLLSTVLSMAFFSLPWLYYNVTKRLLGGDFKKYIRTVAGYTAACAVTCILSYVMCKLIPEGTSLVGVIIIRLIVSCIAPISTIYVLFRNSENWKWLREALGIMLRQGIA